MKRLWMTLGILLWPAWLAAQPAPLVGTTIKATSTSATALCIGCPLTSSTPAANSGAIAASITLTDGAPSITTGKLYQVGSALYFSGLSLATGSSVSGSTGTVPKFTGPTALGDSNATISGSNWTITGTLTTSGFIGSCALCTSIPTSAVSSGNFVATVASGTGITSSVTTGNAAATAISLNNTAVTPSTYGSATAHSVFTVDQQGRITSATTATPQLTLTSTYFSSLDGSNLTNVALLTAANVFTNALNTFQGELRVSSAGATDDENLSIKNGTRQWNLRVNGSADTFSIRDITGSSTDRLTISNTGAISASGRYNSATLQPGFLAYNSSADALQSTGATVQFDTEVYDEAGNFSSNTFTAPVAGRYLFTACVDMDTGSATAQTRQITLLTTQFPYRLGGEVTTLTGDQTIICGSVIAPMAVSDTASMNIILSTGTVTIQAAGSSPLLTFFSGRLLP